MSHRSEAVCTFSRTNRCCTVVWSTRKPWPPHFDRLCNCTDGHCQPSLELINVLSQLSAVRSHENEIMKQEIVFAESLVISFLFYFQPAAGRAIQMYNSSNTTAQFFKHTTWQFAKQKSLKTIRSKTPAHELQNSISHTGIQ